MSLQQPLEPPLTLTTSPNMRRVRSRLASAGSSLWQSPRRACCGATLKSPDQANASSPSGVFNMFSHQSVPSGGDPQCPVHLGRGYARQSSTAMSVLSTCTTSRIFGSVRIFSTRGQFFENCAKILAKGHFHKS